MKFSEVRYDLNILCNKIVIILDVTPHPHFSLTSEVGGKRSQGTGGWTSQGAGGRRQGDGIYVSLVKGSQQRGEIGEP